MAPDEIATVTTDTFDDLVLGRPGPIAVEFMSYGCGHCRVIEPILQQIAAAEAGREAFYRVNVPVEPGLADRYQVQGTPTLIMFADGVEVGRVEGPHPTLASVHRAVTEPFAVTI
jgi:thioredoxin 1